MGNEVPRNIASVIHGKAAIYAFSIVAAGGGDNTLKVGEVIDLNGLPAKPLSAEICITAIAVLASAKKLLVDDIKMEHDVLANFSTPTDLQVFTETLTVLDAANAERGELRLAINLSSAKRFIRFEMLPDLDASGTDTAILHASITFGGFDSVPVA